MTAPTEPRQQPCDACRAEIARWYDYRAPRPVQFANHADYDETGRGIADNGRTRFEQWRDTVRYQQDLIRRQCSEQHGHGELRVGSLFSGYGGLGGERVGR